MRRNEGVEGIIGLCSFSPNLARFSLFSLHQLEPLKIFVPSFQ